VHWSKAQLERKPKDWDGAMLTCATLGYLLIKTIRRAQTIEHF